MTQLELSEKTGINQAVISKYESGERTPTTDKKDEEIVRLKLIIAEQQIEIERLKKLIN